MTATIADIGARALRRLGVAVVAASDRPPAGASVPAATLATRALQWLGVVASDETPIASDQALALAKVQAVHAGLNAQGIVTWTVDAVPLAHAEDYTMLAAAYLAPAFGKAADPQMIPVIEARIRKATLLAKAPAMAEDAVMDVHGTLAARGKVRWSIFDIPDYAASAYEILAANHIAPTFGLPVDASADAEAMRNLTQAMALATSGEHVRAEYF